ncbi:hypothetical protein IKQ19_16025 [Candidatus Saccharibacteria bacterium]|jgi:hypothetical protein|nr:hypothetical protein [Candidatus Saccharibacteria bacterium]
MNNEELFDLADNHSAYTEPWQYTTWRTTHKAPEEDESGKPIPEDPNDLSTLTVVRNSTHRNRFAVGVKNFTFDELVEATRQGHSLKRIGSNIQGSRFLVIDLDNDGDENITSEELDSFCTDTIKWTPGGSNRPYRYHLFVFLTAPLVTRQEFKEQSEKVLKRLAEHLDLEKAIKVDDHQFSYLQWCYGVPQTQLDHMEESILPGTLYRSLQIEKKKGFQVFKVDPSAPEEKTSKKVPQHPNETSDRAQLMPYTSAMLASKLSEGSLYAQKDADGSYINPKVCLEGKRFDIFEPRLSKKHIAKGNRFKTAQAWVFRLVPQFYRCKSLGLEYNDEDLVFTFYILCKRNFQSFEPWWTETGKSLVAGLLSELHTNDNLGYDEIAQKYNASHSGELYRRMGYNLAMTMDIIDQYAFVSKKDSTAMFPCKNELENILKASHISYSSFMHYMTLLDLKVIYRTDKRSDKHEYLRDRLIFGTCYYTKFNEAHKNYCKRHGIHYVSMYKLYSGSKAEYNHILQVTDDAIKAMFKFFNSQEQKPSPINQNEEEKPNEEEECELPEDLPF